MKKLCLTAAITLLAKKIQLKYIVSSEVGSGGLAVMRIYQHYTEIL